MRTVSLLTEVGARAVVDAAVREARANGWALAIAVYDSCAQLLAFHRMDGAKPVTIDTALAKAKGAANLGVPTVRLRDMLVDGDTSLLAIPGVVPLGGGVPIVVDGHMLGAVGVSGGTTEEDIQVAEAGIRAVTG